MIFLFRAASLNIGLKKQSNVMSVKFSKICINYTCIFARLNKDINFCFEVSSEVTAVVEQEASACTYILSFVLDMAYLRNGAFYVNISPYS